MSKLFRWLAGVTVVACLLPFVIYSIQRLTGGLPGPEQWLEEGMNHGPWRWEWSMLLIGYPLVLLAVISIIATISDWIRQRRLRIIAYGVSLLALQFAAPAAQIYVLGWTID